MRRVHKANDCAELDVVSVPWAHPGGCIRLAEESQAASAKLTSQSRRNFEPIGRMSR